MCIANSFANGHTLKDPIAYLKVCCGDPGEDNAGAGEQAQDYVAEVVLDEAPEDDRRHDHQHSAKHGPLPTKAVT